MNVPLFLFEQDTPSATAASPVPVTFGVPLAVGTVHEPGPWALVAPDGTASAVDVRVTETWPDGSARWVLVDSQVPIGRKGTGWHLETDGTTTDPDRGITLEESPETIAIDTGVLRLVVARHQAFPWRDLQTRGTATSAGASGSLVVTEADGTSHALRVDRMSVEHRGRLRVTVRVAGSAALSGCKRVEVEGRLDAYAGHAAIRVRIALRNPDRAEHPGNFWDLGDRGSVLLEDVTLAIGAPGEPLVSIECSAEPGAPSIGALQTLSLYQDSSGGERWQSTNHINRERRVPLRWRGYRLEADGAVTTGLRATPVTSVRSGDWCLAASVPAFWQNFPKGIEASAEGLRVGLFPGRFDDLHEIQGGEQKTHEFHVWLGPARASAGVLEWTRKGLLVTVAPGWIVASGAIDYLAPLDADHRGLVDQAIEGPDRFEAKREVIDQYGWRHFGEIYGDHEAVGHTGSAPLVSHYNNQYDPVAGFALQYLRTGDARWWTAMHELARHVIDVDIYHTDQDKAAYNGGLFWHTYHYGDADTATHRTYPKRNTGTVFGGGPSADHNYPTGLALHYLLTGDEASREAAIGLAEYVLRIDNGKLSPFRWLSTRDTGRAYFTPPDFFGPARASGNSLNALVDGHRLSADRRFLDKADQIVQRVIHPRDDLQKSRLDDPEYRWFYAMFLQALGKYLTYKAALGQLDRAYAHGRESLLAYARWMAVHEYPYLDRPEKLEFPTETWAAQDIRKSDIFYYAAMHASGEERKRFVERGTFFHRHSVSTLLHMPTRHLARPVIVLLTSGFLHPWFTAHPDASLPPGPPLGDPGRPVDFVSQRTQAIARAKQLVAVGALGGAILTAAGIYWWLL